MMSAGAVWLAGVLATTFVPSNHVYPPLLSNEAKTCFEKAMGEASEGKYQPALAHLDSLLLSPTVTVGVDFASIPSGGKGFAEGVEVGLDIWRNYLEDAPFRFSQAPKPQVQVKFVASVPTDGNLQGLIEARHEYQWTTNHREAKLSATLYVAASTEGRLLARNEVAQIVAHELGHLLGLSDSTDAEALMGPFNPYRPCMNPSRKELESVRSFRQTLREHVARIEKLARND